MMLIRTFRLLVPAAALMMPALALACATPQMTGGEDMSPEGAKTLVHWITSDSVFGSHLDRRRVIRAQLEAAVVAEPPNWQLIERLQSEEFSSNIDSTRLAHEETMKFLMELSRRDRGIYLLATMSGSSSGAPRDENGRRAEAIRLEILASARCLIPDEAKLKKLLVEYFELEIRSETLALARRKSSYANKSPSDKIAHLRNVYRKIGPVVTSEPDKAETRGNDPK